MGILLYSSVLGKNQRFGHLTKFGKVICKILDTIDKNHCEKSIDNLNESIKKYK